MEMLCKHADGEKCIVLALVQLAGAIDRLAVCHRQHTKVIREMTEKNDAVAKERGKAEKRLLAAYKDITGR